jgi:hypothetical protein
LIFYQQQRSLGWYEYEWAVKLKSKGMPSVKKETVTSSLYAMIRAAIISLLAVIMSKTKPITWPKALWKVLFLKTLFLGRTNQRLIT